MLIYLHYTSWIFSLLSFSYSPRSLSSRTIYLKHARKFHLHLQKTWFPFDHRNFLHFAKSCTQNMQLYWKFCLSYSNWIFLQAQDFKLIIGLIVFCLLHLFHWAWQNYSWYLQLQQKIRTLFLSYDYLNSWSFTCRRFLPGSSSSCPATCLFCPEIYTATLFNPLRFINSIIMIIWQTCRIGPSVQPWIPFSFCPWAVIHCRRGRRLFSGILLSSLQFRLTFLLLGPAASSLG